MVVKWLYFCLVNVALFTSDRMRWTRVSEVVVLDHRITADNFDTIKQYIEQQVCASVEGAVEGSLEDYRLVSVRAEMSDPSEAQALIMFIETLGRVATRNGAEVSVALE